MKRSLKAKHAGRGSALDGGTIRMASFWNNFLSEGRRNAEHVVDNAFRVVTSELDSRWLMTSVMTSSGIVGVVGSMVVRGPKSNAIVWYARSGQVRLTFPLMPRFLPSLTTVLSSPRLSQSSPHICGTVGKIFRTPQTTSDLSIVPGCLCLITS